jgi:hypothetical protein
MNRNNRELWLALLAMLFISAIYLLVVNELGQIPGASGFFGHSLGILGFILMIITETLYSLRKRSRSARWGKMASWLQFHIFTGLVGPFLVLLHSSWKFNGLAGIVMLLTIIIVLSGVVGRYIYTAIPRTADGIEIESTELEHQIAIIELKIQDWERTHPQARNVLAGASGNNPVQQKSIVPQFWGRGFSEWYSNFQWRLHQRRMNVQIRDQTRALGKLEQQRRTLSRQIVTLSIARRMLSLWHTIHIPIGLALFVTAFIHILAAIYYATLLR